MWVSYLESRWTTSTIAILTTTLPNGKHIPPLYGGLVCLANSTKGKSHSSGCAEYTSLEPGRELRNIAQRFSPLTDINLKDKMPKSIIMQYGICGIYSPSEQHHIETLPGNSIRLFTAVIPKQESLQPFTTSCQHSTSGASRTKTNM